MLIRLIQWFFGRSRRKLLATRMPREHCSLIESRVPWFDQLSAKDQQTLLDTTRILIAEKNWEPCGDLEAVTAALEIDRMVGLQGEAGSDWIKVMATGGVFTPNSRARDSQFDLPRLISLVEAAARAGRSVAAHCHGTAGMADAVRAGVRTIEHASFAGPDGFGTAIDESLVKEMARSELWVSPTVNAGWGRRILNEHDEPSNFFRRMSTSLRMQRDHGVRFIASTDAGIPGVAHHDLVDGLLAFERFAGLRPVDVLRAATSEAATALGIAERTGRIAPGLSADLLVLASDPLEDLTALRDPEAVVFRGEWLSREMRPDATADAN